MHLTRDQEIRAAKNEERLRELRRCQTDTYYLATKYLGYEWNRKLRAEESKAAEKGQRLSQRRAMKLAGAASDEKGLTESLHKPMFAWADDNEEHPQIAMVLPRGQHKTTWLIAKIVQYVLQNPWTAILYAHAVEELASDVVQEAAIHFQFNDALRSLDPIATDPTTGKPYRCFPRKNKKRFASSYEFTINRPPTLGGEHIYQRFPTLRGVGVGTEIRGAHALIGMPDDIATPKGVDEAGGPEKLKAWYYKTFYHCIDSKKFRAALTRVDERSIYEEWFKSGDWLYWIRSGAEVEPNPPNTVPSEDNFSIERGEPIHFGPPGGVEAARKRLVFDIRQSGEDAWPEIGNIPRNPGTVAWDRACEHYVDPKTLGKGLIIVFSDPAPKGIGGEGNEARTQLGRRKDDDWAWAALHVSATPQGARAVLLDGDFSRDWPEDVGTNQIVSAMAKWSTPYFAIEEYGSAVGSYCGKVVARCKTLNQRFYSEVDAQGRNRGLQMQGLHQKGAKGVRFGLLVGMARQGLFLISNGCPKKFTEKFIEQCRAGMRATHDDVRDSVSFVTDAALDKIRPQVAVATQQPGEDWGDDDDYNRVSRYCTV